MKLAVILATPSTDTCSLITNLLHFWGITTDNVMFSNSALLGDNTTQHYTTL